MSIVFPWTLTKSTTKVGSGEVFSLPLEDFKSYDDDHDDKVKYKTKF